MISMIASGIALGVIWVAFGWLPAACYLAGFLFEVLTHRCPSHEPSAISKADCVRMTVEGER